MDLHHVELIALNLYQQSLAVGGPRRAGPTSISTARSTGADLTQWNDLPRAYLHFDVQQGGFSLYTELARRTTADEDPHLGFWTTLGNVVRNAFIESFQPQLDRSVGAR